MCWFVVCLCLVAIQQIKLINILPELMFVSLCSFVKSWYFFLGENLTVFLCFQDAGKAKETLVVGWIPSCLDPWHQPSCATWLKSALRHFKFLWASGRRRPRGVLGSRKHVGPNHVRPAEEKMFDQPWRKEKQKEKNLSHLCLTTPNQMLGLLEGKEKYGLPITLLGKQSHFPCSGSRSAAPDRTVGAPEKPGQHVAAEMIPHGSTSCGPPDKTHTHATWKPPHNPKSQGGVAYTLSLRNSCTAIFRLQVCVYAATGD